MIMTFKHIFLLLAASGAAFAQVRIPGPGGSPSTVPVCVPASGYAHCRKLTVDHTQVGGSTLTSFPVLVSGTLGSSRVQNANCYDVVFTSDSAGATLIPWEIESCTQSTGDIIMWALPSSLSSSADTAFYISYDNAAVSTHQNTGSVSAINVWSSSYALVHHLKNGSTLSLADSTSNTNNGSNNGATATTGEIDGAAAFNGTSQDYTVTNSTSLNNWTNLTVSFWVKGVAAQPSLYNRLIEKGANSEFTIVTNFAGTQDGKVYVQSLGTSGSPINTSAVAFDNTWHYVVVQMQYGGGSASTGQIWVDGTSSVGPSSLGSTTFTRTGDLNIAAFNTGSSNFFQGSMDEIHYLTTLTSSGWITAEYNNQKTSSTFVTIGSEI